MFDRLTYDGQRESLAHLQGTDGFRFIRGDVEDGATVRRSMLLEGVAVAGPIGVVDGILGRETNVSSAGPSRHVARILGDETTIRM
ncbi:MAG: hypothetical protein ACHQ16_03755 [Candidatus Lutacidiplasmatales archaeon]